MTTLKHSPGPWRAGSVPAELRAEVYVKGGRHLANVYAATKTPDQATADANARLIAAAPDLLAALQIIADSEELNGDTVVCDFDTLQSVAREAIRKATA